MYTFNKLINIFPVDYLIISKCKALNISADFHLLKFLNGIKLQNSRFAY